MKYRILIWISFLGQSVEIRLYFLNRKRFCIQTFRKFISLCVLSKYQLNFNFWQLSIFTLSGSSSDPELEIWPTLPSKWRPFNNSVIFRPLCFKFGLEVDLRMGNVLKVTGTKSFNWSFYETVLRWSSSRILTLDFFIIYTLSHVKGVKNSVMKVKDCGQKHLAKTKKKKSKVKSRLERHRKTFS